MLHYCLAHGELTGRITQTYTGADDKKPINTARRRQRVRFTIG
jgi:hypothetical protein